MATINVTTASLTLAGQTAGIGPIVRKGGFDLDIPMLPVPPSLLRGQVHPDPLVKEIVSWANALSERLQKLLSE